MKCPYCGGSQSRSTTTSAGRHITECISCGRVVSERQTQSHHLFHTRAQDSPLCLVTSDLPTLPHPITTPSSNQDQEDPFEPTGFITAFSTWSLEPYPVFAQSSLSFSGHLAELERVLETTSSSSASGPSVVVDNLRAYLQIIDVASILGLDCDISDHAFQLFRDCSSATCLRNRSVEALATAALVQAIREAQEPRTLQEISIAANLPQKEIGKYIKILGEALQLSQPLNSNSISVHMPRFCTLLQLNKSAQELATHIGEVVINKCFCTRRNPISISAAAIYLASQLEDKRKTQAEICKVTGLTEVTLRKVYKELLENWDDLLPSNYTPAIPPEKAFPSATIPSGRSSASTPRISDGVETEIKLVERDGTNIEPWKFHSQPVTSTQEMDVEGSGGNARVWPPTPLSVSSSHGNARSVLNPEAVSGIGDLNRHEITYLLLEASEKPSLKRQLRLMVEESAAKKLKVAELALARSKGFPGRPPLVPAKAGATLELPAQTGGRRRRSAAALLAGVDENEERLLREVTERPEEHRRTARITFETPRVEVESPETEVQEAGVVEEAVPVTAVAGQSSTSGDATLSASARLAAIEMGLDPDSVEALGVGQVRVFSNAPPGGATSGPVAGEEGGVGVEGVVGTTVVGGPQVLKSAAEEAGPSKRDPSDTYIPVEDVDKYFAPNWTLRQGDYLKGAEVCAQFVNGAVPPAESIFQRRRPREDVFNDANIHLARFVSTYSEITRDWRELVVSEKERRVELEAGRREVEAAVAAKNELSWKLATAESDKAKMEADHKAAKAKWQAAWEKSNASIEALKLKNQEEVGATEEARALVKALENQNAKHASENETLKSRIKELEATVAGAIEEKENIAQVNMTLERQVVELASDRQWLISKGLSGAGHVLLQSEEYIALLNDFVSANRLVAREKGVREGYAHCQAGNSLESFPPTKEKAEKLLHRQARCFTYTHHPFLEQFHKFAADPDLATVKALVDFDDLSSSPEKDEAGPSTKLSNIPDAEFIGDEHLDLEDSDQKGYVDVTEVNEPADVAQGGGGDDAQE